MYSTKSAGVYSRVVSSRFVYSRVVYFWFVYSIRFVYSLSAFSRLLYSLSTAGVWQKLVFGKLGFRFVLGRIRGRGAVLRMKKDELCRGKKFRSVKAGILNPYRASQNKRVRVGIPVTMLLLRSDEKIRRHPSLETR